MRAWVLQSISSYQIATKDSKQEIETIKIALARDQNYDLIASTRANNGSNYRANNEQ